MIETKPSQVCSKWGSLERQEFGDREGAHGKRKYHGGDEAGKVGQPHFVNRQSTFEDACRVGFCLFDELL
jgi:hypothetical protein